MNSTAARFIAMFTVVSSCLQAGEFQSLFDGQTLTGWHVSAKSGHSQASRNQSGGKWSVVDGAIEGTQDIPGNGGLILTDEQFGDFEVALEMNNDFGPDSGLFLRSTEDGKAWQAMIDYHSDGNLMGIYGEGLGARPSVRNFSFGKSVTAITEVAAPGSLPLPVKRDAWPAFWRHGQWNELRARIVGNPPQIHTWINGVPFAEWRESEVRHPARGSIGLQVHGGGDFTKQSVRYRNIRVRKLDSEPTRTPIRVIVWDEQQPQQRMAYTNFLGEEIAAYLRLQPGLQVVSRKLNDPEQGLGAASLDACDVLIWWGHVRHKEISEATGRDIVRRIRSGKLSLIALHSAHWSTPFVEAMKDRAREDALKSLSEADRRVVEIVETNRYPQFFTAPKYDDFITPFAWYQKPAEGRPQVTLALPNCCFPGYRPDAKPSRVKVLIPGHPIMRGLPAEFSIPRTEMYNEPFHVPPPDEVVFEEHWESGEWFRSGSVWRLGKGQVFYFRPGHELYPVFKESTCLRILDNAVRWLANQP